MFFLWCLMPLLTIIQLYRGGYGLKISGIQIYVKFQIRSEDFVGSLYFTTVTHLSP